MFEELISHAVMHQLITTQKAMRNMGNWAIQHIPKYSVWKASLDLKHECMIGNYFIPETVHWFLYGHKSC